MGSSKVPISASVESAKVGTPRKCETRCNEARRSEALRGARAAGAARVGATIGTARTWASGGNRQSGPVRGYVLYFERLAGRAIGRTGMGGEPVRRCGKQGVQWS